MGHVWLTDNNGQLGTKGKRDKNIGVNTRVKISGKGNGANLRKTLKERNMRAMNTLFQQESDPEKNREKLNTWRSISGKQRGQIDYVNIDTHKANWVQKVDFMGNANPKIENGHKAILMTIENRKKKESKIVKEQPVHVKYDIHKMRKEFENQKYEWEKINEKIKKIKESNMEIKRKNDKIWEKNRNRNKKTINREKSKSKKNKRK